ncbi:U3 small nucleolar RNA-interacting protein 2-like isoform X2 [Anneissia japonica]|uniref:U3 small nucleolar RNA-interacting protein 2-like isoform X2 n=1 Tax=Anneissia japonica TaxID=1529436 RepID=UPI001425605A|nr:U3 small nucleolar RNA-interacting protein 2-like isoform X2 [Anneissia japonica]
MSFFIKGSGKTKTKKRKPTTPEKAVPKKKARRPRNDEILSESDDSDNERKKDSDIELSEAEEETAQEKRLRLTKLYLSQLEQEERDKSELHEIDEDAVAHRLQDEILEQRGKLQRKVAELLVPPTMEDLRVLRGHRLPLTCLVISSDNKFIYSASKDGAIIMWNFETSKKIKIIPGGRKGTEDTHIGHTTQVLALAISTDNKFLASGCKSKVIHIWNPQSMERIHTFKGHRDSISGLAFRKGTHQLFSASHDRSVKVWNLDEMAYVETLFGHQDSITAIDSLTRDRAVTAGSRDNTVRIWKIPEESQLVFKGHSGSIDCIRLINEEHMISGGEDGSVAVWSIMKKKPIAVVENAHENSDGARHQQNWISAVAALHNTDLLATGSRDSFIRLWHCGTGFRSLTPLFNIPVMGSVNDLQFTSDGRHLVAAVGQEHKWGRWWRLKNAKNCIVIIKLKKDKDV